MFLWKCRQKTYWRDCRSKHTVNEYLGVTVCYLLMKRTFNLHTAVSVYRIIHNRDKFSTRVLSIHIPNNEREDHRQFLKKIQWASDDHFLWCCTIPAISKKWRHKLHPKKFVQLLRNRTLNEFQCSLNLSREKEVMVMKFRTPNYMKYNC